MFSEVPVPVPKAHRRRRPRAWRVWQRSNLDTYFVVIGDHPVLVHNHDHDRVNLGDGYEARLDEFAVRGNVDFEIHVYRNGTEVGIFGSDGWFNKHGIDAGSVDVPPSVENALKGMAIDHMRRSGRLPPKAREISLATSGSSRGVSQMQYVVAETRERGRVFLSADEYLERLPSLAQDLPTGARQYVSDPDHYDFYSERCVKDLKLAHISFAPGEAHRGVTARFRFNDLGVAEELAVAWVGVVELALQPIAGRGDLASLGALMLDEVLPASSGVTHELAFHGGHLGIRCGDIWAAWQPPGSSHFPVPGR